MDLDKDNPIFHYAAQFILNGMDDKTDIVFLTGKAGTGKTTFLKYIATEVKNRVILAPTGVAAINAGGQTIHSFFHLNPNIIYTPDNPNLSHNAIFGHLGLNNARKKTIEKMELLIIDEVSMLRCEILDAIDRILKAYRHSSSPFGGVPTLLIGDVFQLPPVVKNGEWNVLQQFYDTEHFFSSNVYKRANTKFFELEKVYRQEDKRFIDVLNHIRTGQFDLVDMSILNENVRQPLPDDSPVYIYPFNERANGLNQSKYNELHTTEYIFNGTVCGNFNVENLSNVEKIICLKIGARVMTTVNVYNDGGDFIYYNGSIGNVTAIDPDLRWINVRMADNGKEVTVWKYVWKNVQQIYDEEEDRIVEVELGSFTQIPVRLAWAITIHKSQGLTLNSIQVNVNGAFAHGQTYVALSRCRSLSGLYLEQPVGSGTVIVDQKVVDFYKSVHEEFFRVFKEAEEVKQIYDNAVKCFNEINGAGFIESICKARKLNNYITKFLHTEFEDKVSKFADEFRLNRVLAVTAVKAQLLSQTLQKDLDSANNYIENLDTENTKLHIKCDTQTKRINELEEESIINQQTVVKLSSELQNLKQHFIEKTIELDRLKKDSWFKRLFKIGW